MCLTILWGWRSAFSGLWGLVGCVRGLVGGVQGRGLGARASPSGFYPAGKLQWHFACGFDFGHGL